MSGMHLVGPALTTTGRRRGKQRWASAEQKRKSEALKAEWTRTLAEIDKLKPGFSGDKKLRPVPNAIPQYSACTPPGRETPRIESQDTGWVTCTAVQDNTYTGDKVLGVSVLHKSNGVPVFSQQDVLDISKMRR